MGWNNQNVTSLLIINASGGFTGLFVYNPSPGPGNLIASIAAQAGTDPYGNAYQQGIAAYGPAAAGVSQVTAQNWGGGGGGSGNRTTDTTGGSSGGGGEFAQQTVAVTPGHTYTVVVAAGGTAGAIGGAGGPGGNSTFTGDSVTVTAHGGQGGVDAPAAGGLGGTGSTATTHFNGGNGAAGSGVSGSAGGGSSAGTGAPGNPGAVNAGGIAPAGGGNGANGFPAGDHPGGAGFAPGGGASGALASTINEPGGAGAAGQVILTWAGGTVTFATPGTFTWTAPTGAAAEIFLNVVASALSLFFYTGAGSDAFPGAHFFATVFNAGLTTEQIELAIIGPTSTSSRGRVDIQLLSDGASSPAIATGFVLYNDTANVEHQVADWGQHGFAGLITQKLVGAQPGTIDTTLAAETWHNLSLVGGVFTAGTVTPQYRFEPIGTAGIVRLRGNGTLAANEPANTQIASLPAGYQPAFNQFLVAGNNLSGATAGAADLSVSPAGAIFITQAGTLGNEVIFDGITFPID